MNKVVEEQMAFLKHCLSVMNKGNYKHLSETSLKTIDRIEEQLRLCGVGVPKGTLCECGGNERVALDCTRKPCEHPQYFNL